MFSHKYNLNARFTTTEMKRIITIISVLSHIRRECNNKCNEKRLTGKIQIFFPVKKGRNRKEKRKHKEFILLLVTTFTSQNAISKKTICYIFSRDDLRLESYSFFFHGCLKVDNAR